MLGVSNSMQVDPKEIFRMAIYKMAVSMILIHNHPSGELSPSEADMDMTDRLIKSGELLGIQVIDHLIISEKHYLSFDREGLMDELRSSDKYKL
ncbi:JAB domain-containing protein [Fulvivirgaceae bacterium BMA12]|uniref:JAB domain-containing protein n=1 Tax=Agaribacillus aureus TaxID=3051825 RepID=A0ABT8LJI0_9BACT|nr:JAB domain-containing protein [Fulvivirgaceae bacterium BMA12]